MDYTVRFIVGKYSNRKRTGYGQFLVAATDDQKAVVLANDTLQFFNERIRPALVLEQEIMLPDGWHYFSANNVKNESRPAPSLSPQSADKVYTFN
ncbi:MAG TPA: hypothetical protein VI968_03160 [archaeon]|nr:hypothetical protein [archaeon]